jgi:hypothetical protein
MPVLADRPNLPLAARWTALGGFLIEIGTLATAAQLASGGAAPSDLGAATFALFLLGLVVAAAGASAFVVPWTSFQRAIGGIAGGVSLLLGAGELGWGGTLAVLVLIGGALALVAELRWPLEAGHVPRGPLGRARGG